MRKQGMNTGLGPGRIEKEFGLAVFMLDCVVGRDRDLTVGLMIAGDAVTKQHVV